MKKIVLVSAILLLFPVVAFSTSIPIDGNGRGGPITFAGCSGDITDVDNSPNINLEIQTNCSDVTGLQVSSTGVTTTCSTNYSASAILSAADYSGGGGGRGYRRYFGDTAHDETPHLILRINGYSKGWMRYYIRVHVISGTTNLSNTKANYFHNLSSAAKIWWYLTSSDGLSWYDGGFLAGCSNCGFVSKLGSPGNFYRNDTWESFEIYWEDLGSTTLVRAWLNGVLADEKTLSYDLGTVHGIDFYQSYKGGGGCGWMDIDDIVVSTDASDPALITDASGNLMIGPIGGVGADPYVSVTAFDAVATEQGQTSGIFRLSRSPDTSGDLAVAYTITGTATGGGTDYQALSGNATILDGNTTVDVTVTAVDDAAIEGDETVIMNLTDGASYDLGNPSTATIIITDNDQTPPPPITLLYLDFENGIQGLIDSGCYDNVAGQVLVYDAARDAADGADSGMVAEYNFAAGNSSPDSGGAMRIQFSETPELYVRFWMKTSTNWVGTNVATIPSHLLYAMTNVEGSYDGLANTHLTAYFETAYNTVLDVSFQDARNIDTDLDGVNDNYIGVDLTGNTPANCGVVNCFTQGAAHGCQGNFTNSGTVTPSCYDIGASDHRNSRGWYQTVTAFNDGNWHQVQYYVKMNTLTGSTINEDGIIKIWIDDLTAGNEVFSATDVVMKKGWTQSQFWNQIILAPYISGGNPLSTSQSILIDDVLIGTQDGDVVAPATSSHSPAKNATGVATNADISFDITDGGDGVNATTINVDIEGTNYGCSGQETNCTGSGAPYAYCTGSGTGNTSLTCAGSSASYTVTKSSNTWSNSQVVNIATDASDNTNSMVTDVWQFTVTAATPVPPGTAQASGSGSVSNPGGGTGYFSQTAP